MVKNYVGGYASALAPVTTNGIYWVFMKNKAGVEKVMPFAAMESCKTQEELDALWDISPSWHDDCDNPVEHLARLYADGQARKTGTEGYVEVDVQWVAG